MTSVQHILITGISSLLIRDLVKQIDLEKFRILCVTRNRSKLTNTDIELLEGDICDPAFVNSIIRDNKINIVVHAAAITHTHKTQDYFKVNLQGTINLVNASKQYSVDRFILISSRSAGKKSGAYGLSKLQAEEYLTGNFPRWLIIRPSEIFGADKIEGVDKLINDILHKKIILYPQGVKSRLYPMHYKDASKLISNLIFGNCIDNKLITINGNEGFSYYEMICKINKVLNKKIYIIPVPKFLMFILKWFIKVFGIKSGIVPDQIPRLYSIKETGLQYKTLSIEEYLIALNPADEQKPQRS